MKNLYIYNWLFSLQIPGESKLYTFNEPLKSDHCIDLENLTSTLTGNPALARDKLICTRAGLVSIQDPVPRTFLPIEIEFNGQ